MDLAHPKNKILLSSLVLLIFSQGVLVASESPQKRIPIRIGVNKEAVTTLALVETSKNFFAEEGMLAELRYKATGRQLVDALVSGEVDMALGVSEVPVVFESLKGQPLTILAALGGDDTSIKVVARKSAGITRPEDLAGKRIATQENSTGHFFLHVFLNFSGLSKEDVILSFVKASELPRALEEGRIDAFSMNEASLFRAKNFLSEDAIVFELPHVYFSYELMVTKPSYVHTHPEEIRKVFRALKKAENFSQTKIFLDHGLLIALEDIARWALRDGRARPQRMPNYQGLITPRFMDEIDPKRERF